MDIAVTQSEEGTANFGSYELLAEIARGGMATVYLCRRSGEQGFQRLFALKVMHAHLAEEEEFVTMLLDEARIAARVHHPNAVGIVDIGESKGGYYLVMEYVEGCSLSDILRRQREHRPAELIVPIAIDILRGLHAAHGLTDDAGAPLHLIHRDVSPQNILVGIDGVARITDFGIAKAEARITSTRPGMFKGKLQYMSPEQLRSRDLDPRSDLFSMGVVMWESLTGERLFRGPDDAATVHNIIQKEVLPPSTIGLKPPAVLDEIILKALQRNPDDRYASAGEMARDLRTVAMKADLLGAPSDIGEWVVAVYGERLAQRRQAIIDSSSGARIATVREGNLSLPSLTTGDSLPRLPTPTPSFQAFQGSGFEPLAAGLATPISGIPAPRRRGWMIGGAVALIAVAVGTVFAVVGLSPEQVSLDEPEPAPTIPVTAPPEPAPEPPPATDDVAIGSAPSLAIVPEETVVAEEPAEEATPRPELRGRSRRWRRPTRSPTSRRAVIAAPEPEPTVVPPTPAPRRVRPAPSDYTERNPYLRRD